MNNLFRIEFVGEVNSGLTKDKFGTETFSNKGLFNFCQIIT